MSDNLQDGIIKLFYYDRGAVEYRVFDRLCVDRKCVMSWDGAEHSVYMSSTVTCAGYETGEMFLIRFCLESNSLTQKIKSLFLILCFSFSFKDTNKCLLCVIAYLRKVHWQYIPL